MAAHSSHILGLCWLHWPAWSAATLWTQSCEHIINDGPCPKAMSVLP